MNFTLLGLIIEKITQNTAETEIRRRILDPLEMGSTYLEGFEEPAELPERVPHRDHYATEELRNSQEYARVFRSMNGRETPSLTPLGPICLLNG
jgi:D-alanyl-D-alanine carboxypeptidase